MIEIKTKLRKWGNSLGVVIPLKAVEEAKAKEGEDVVIFLAKEKDTVLREMFGTYKFKKSTEKLMKELDKELYNDWELFILYLFNYLYN